jgi:hypothetical protein
MPVPEDMNTKDIAPPSSHIKAADMPPGWRAELVISDINIEAFKRDTDKYERNKFVFSFVGKEKTYVCNATNAAFMEAALGSKPAKWVGATITMSVAKVKGPNGPVDGFLIVSARPAAPGTKPPTPAATF